MLGFAACTFQSVERLGRQKAEVYEAEVSTVEGVTWRVRKRANEWAMLRAAIKQECLEGGGGELSAAYLQLKRPSVIKRRSTGTKEVRRATWASLETRRTELNEWFEGLLGSEILARRYVLTDLLVLVLVISHSSVFYYLLTHDSLPHRSFPLYLLTDRSTCAAPSAAPRSSISSR